MFSGMASVAVVEWNCHVTMDSTYLIFGHFFLFFLPCGLGVGFLICCHRPLISERVCSKMMSSH